MPAPEASDENSDLKEDSSSSDSMNAQTKTLSSDDSDIEEVTFRLQPERIGHFTTAEKLHFGSRFEELRFRLKIESHFSVIHNGI